MVQVHFLYRTLAGSTIMLLTAAWAGSLAIGKCDLGSSGEAIEGTGYGKVKCFNQVETMFFKIFWVFLFHHLKRFITRQLQLKMTCLRAFWNRIIHIDFC